jgi:hypothetical protein
MQAKAITTALLFAATLSSSAIANQSDKPPITCQSNPGYVICEASSEPPREAYDWTTTGDLAINVASGPLISIRCEEGDAGQLRLDQERSSKSEALCLQIECGSTGSINACSEEGAASPKAASTP